MDLKAKLALACFTFKHFWISVMISFLVSTKTLHEIIPFVTHVAGMFLRFPHMLYFHVILHMFFMRKGCMANPTLKGFDLKEYIFIKSYYSNTYDNNK